jgi:thiol-disulfide isomerase/thioredoxin
MMRIIFALSFCIFLISAAAQPPLFDTVPDFTVTDISGHTHRLYSYLEEDKYVGLDFFGLSCAPCIALVPVINQAFTKYGCNQNEVIIIALNMLNNDEAVSAFKQQYGGLYPAVSGIEGGGEAVYYDWQIQFWPQFVVIHPNKTLIANIDPINLDVIDSVFNAYGIQPDTCNASGISPHFLNPNEIRVFPNPSEGRVFIDFNTIPAKEIKYKVYNSLGNVVKTGITDKDSFVDISTYGSGIFVIQFVYDEMIVNKKILIK